MCGISNLLNKIIFDILENHPDQPFLEQMVKVLDLCVALWGRLHGLPLPGELKLICNDFLQVAGKNINLLTNTGKN